MVKMINDVATDVQNPPQYVRANIGDLPESNKKAILESYPDLKPLRFPAKDPAAVFSAMLVSNCAQGKQMGDAWVAEGTTGAGSCKRDAQVATDASGRGAG